MRISIRSIVCAAAVTLAATPLSTFAAGTVTVAGSTNPAAAVTDAAKAYQAAHPGVAVTVTGSSSGAGIAALRDGTIDIAMSDVAVNDPAFVDHVIGVLGIAIIADPRTGVKNVTRAQMIGIYSGKITNWKQLGGIDERIVPMSRPIGTGTRFVFEKLVAKTPIETKAPEKASELSSIVAQTPGAIAYVGTAFVKPDANVAVLSYNGVQPTPENVRDHRYTFAADEHLYTAAKSSAEAKAFVEFVTSDKEALTKSGIY